MKPKISFLISLIFFSWILIFPVVAATPPKPDHRCDSDIQIYCTQVPHEGTRVNDCLYQKRDKLTQECRDITLAIRQRIHEQREECRPDAEKFCLGIEHGGGRIHECLKKHLSELVAACRDNFSEPTADSL